MDNPGLRNILQETLRQTLGNVCLSSAGLTIGSSSAAAVKIANTTTYVVDNVFCSKTTAEIAFTDLTVQPVSTYAKYAVALNANGDGIITNGTPAATAAAAEMPNCPDDYVTIGYVLVATNASVPFTPATTLLSASGITDTYVNLMWDNSY